MWNIYVLLRTGIYIRTKICGIYIINYDISVDLKMLLTQKMSSMATMTQTKDAKWAFCFRISMNHCKISIDIHTLFIVIKKHWEIESIDVGEVTKGWSWWQNDEIMKVAQRKMLWVIRVGWIQISSVGKSICNV